MLDCKSVCEPKQRVLRVIADPLSYGCSRNQRQMPKLRTPAASSAEKRFCICFGLSRSFVHTSVFEVPISPA